MKFIKLAILVAITIALPIVPAVLLLDYIVSRMFNRPTIVADWAIEHILYTSPK